MENLAIDKSAELRARYLKERERYERVSLKPWVRNLMIFFALIMFIGSGVMFMVCVGNAYLLFEELLMSDKASAVGFLIWLGRASFFLLLTGFGLFLFDYLVGLQKIRDLGVRRCQEMVDLVAKDEDVKRYRDAVVEKGSELLLFDLYKAREIVKWRTQLNESESVRAVCKKAHGLIN